MEDKREFEGDGKKLGKGASPQRAGREVENGNAGPPNLVGHEKLDILDVFLGVRLEPV